MKLAYRKVWRDLWNNKGRTVLVVLSIAVGIIAVGMISTTNTILSRQMTIAQINNQPSNAKLFLDKSIDYETVQAMARLPEVGQAEGAIETSIRWKLTRDGEWEQNDAILIARDNYKYQLFDLVTLLDGRWPDSKSIAVEFNHVEPFGIPPIGGVIYFEVNERTVPVTIGGLVRDPSQFPPPNAQAPTFYVTRDVMAQLKDMDEFNVLRFTIPTYSDDLAETAVDVVKTKLSKLDISVTYYEIQDPQRHPLQDVVNGVGLVLALMAMMSLGLSTLLVINTVSAVLTQQIPQIGSMKTIGGTKLQIASLYLMGVGGYSVLSLLLAIPLGAIGGVAISNWMLALLNVPTGSAGFQGEAVLYQIMAGLLAPMLAALWPVLRGASITIREAISDYGLGSGEFGTGFIARLLGRVQGLRLLATLPLRNAFRRVGRAALTEITLIISGALFLTVLSAGSSVTNTISQAWESFGFDIVLLFDSPQRFNEVMPIIESNPNVERVEMWVWQSAKANVPGVTGPGSEHDIALRGYPSDTEFFTPQLTAGRELDSTYARGILLNEKLANDMGLGVGDQILIDLGGDRESTWTIVGLIVDLTKSQETAYMDRDALNEELNQVNRASVAEIKLKGVPEDTDIYKKIIQDLRDSFTARGINISSGTSAIQERQQATSQLSILVTVLLIMTVLVAIVGSVGLSGTLSINVIERLREIGVMRAIGASSRDISAIFIGEGLILGILSWLLSIPLSIFAAGFFVQALGQVVGISVRYFYSITGVWLWLVIVAVLSLLASWLPARSATKISVAQSLSYE